MIFGFTRICNLYPVCIVGRILQNFAYKRCRNSNCFSVIIGHDNLFCAVIVTERRAGNTQFSACKGKPACVDCDAVHRNGNDVAERKTCRRAIDFQSIVVKSDVAVVCNNNVKVDNFRAEGNVVYDIIFRRGYAVVYGPESVVFPAFEYALRLCVYFKFVETCKVRNGFVVVDPVNRLRGGVIFGANRKYPIITGVVAADKSERRARSRKSGLTCVYKYTGNLASFLLVSAMVIYSSVIVAACGNRYVLHVNVFYRTKSARAKEIACAGNLCICKRNIS